MDCQKDQYFTRNVIGSASVEFFWGLGFPIVIESTFLQLFLNNLGASSFVIGCVPSLFIIGISIFPVFASYFTRNTLLKRTTVLVLHLLSGLSIFLFGCSMLLFENNASIVTLFFCCYAVFSICMGLTIPVWLNYLVRIFSENRAVKGIGYMMLFQNGAKILSSFVILKVVEKYAFSITSSSIVFIVTGLTFIIGALFFTLTKELADQGSPIEKNTESFVVHTRKSMKEILENRRFLVFLAADLDFYIVLTVLSFYANYAHTGFGIPQSIAAGIFVGCIYAGSVAVNIILGTLDFLSLKRKFILSKYISLTALILLITVPGNWCFFLISFLLGNVRAIRNIVYTPAVKRLSQKNDATSYFALAPVLTLPVGLGFPLLFGKSLDLLSFMEQDSYKILFGFCCIIVCITLIFTYYTDLEKTRLKKK